MISKVMILSRSETARIKPYILDPNKYKLEWDNVFCISINGSHACEGIDAVGIFTQEEIKQNTIPGYTWNHYVNSRILHLEFDDILPDTVLRHESCNDMVYMSVRQAKDTIEFLKSRNRIEGNNLLIVHCHAGVCRSGAVGKFAGWLFGIEEKVLQDNPQIHPNKWVENLLYAAHKGV